MSVVNKDLLFMVLQFLNEAKYETTVHNLEEESGVFFDLKYVKSEVLKGNWDNVEKYLLGFTSVDANQHSFKMFFEIRKHKFLEALDDNDHAKAVDILKKDLIVFKNSDEGLYKEITQLLTLDNFRQHEKLSMYRDSNSARRNFLSVLDTLIQANPVFEGKLQFPNLERSRLQTLVNQSLNWQYFNSLNPRSNAPMDTEGVPQLGAHQDDNTENMMDVNTELSAEGDLVYKIWKVTEISEPAQCRSLQLPDRLMSNKISRLAYTSLGNSILAITLNAIHLLWNWPQNEQNLSGKATTSISPLLWQPGNSNLMINDIADNNHEEVRPCFALSNNDSYAISSSGGRVSLFNTKTFARLAKFMPPPPAASFLLFHPGNNNIFFMGMEDSTIKIYQFQEDKIIKTLEGHHSNRITGLAFSQVLNVLVSSDESAQICVWKWDTWEKQNGINLRIPAGWPPLSDTRVQFQQDQIHFLVLHQSQLAVYETTRLELVSKWIPYGPSAAITDATFSCDGELVYASFMDATICVFSAAKLEPQCRIHPYAYLQTYVRSVYPLVIAAHPSEKNQFAVGLTNGAVHVIEPLESAGRWVINPPHVVNASAFREFSSSDQHRGVHGKHIFSFFR